MVRRPTPWQTVGPFFNDRLFPPGHDDLTRIMPDGPQASGEVIELRGRVLQEGDVPVESALVEIWQANAAGKYDHPKDLSGLALDPHFKGFGRTLTGADGAWRFRTVKPGAVPYAGNRWQAPHVAMSVFAAGLLRRLVTRLYFADEPLTATDPVLMSIPDANARTTLLARRDADGVYSLDIRLRGEGETVFFAE